MSIQNAFRLQHNINISELNNFHKILLISDGTMTGVIERYANENIQAIKLAELFESTASELLKLDTEKRENVYKRKIFLQGEKSKKNWLYAESTVVLHRLEINFRNELIESGQPIGTLWRKYRTETFKEILAYFREDAGSLADYFGIKSNDSLLCRTYRVFSNQKPIMIITEKFPEQYFE